MGKTIDALLQLQSVERELAQLRRRLRTREVAVAAQQRRITQLQGEQSALQEQATNKRKNGDRLELELRTHEEQVSKLRASLNTARTNKEYATILTQINTLKADNAKVEEQALKAMNEVDAVKAEAAKVHEKVAAEQARLDEIRRSSAAEVEKLKGMMAQLEAKRSQAAGGVPKDALAAFERIAGSYDGEGMAPIEVHGDKPPHEYVCGGCFMSLNAEHANALRVRDDIRTCDNCGRILYLTPQETPA